MKETEKHNDNTQRFSFRKYAWKQFKKNIPAFISFWILMLMIFVGVFASFIANDQPLYAKYRGKTFYPAFATHWIGKSVFGCSGLDSTQHPETGNWEILSYENTDWKSLNLESVVWAPVPFSASGQDILNRDFSSPGDVHFKRNANGEIHASEGKFRHRLGTDILGRDVLAGLIHGTKIALLVGVVSMGIAVLIGLFLGAMAGYYGDHGLQLKRLQYWMIFPALMLAWFYGIQIRSYSVSDAMEQSAAYGLFQFFISLLLFVAVFLVVIFLSGKMAVGVLGKKVNLPVDTWISRFIEIFNSMPKLLLILSVSAIVEERSMWLLMVIIGLSSWTEIARFVRAELLRVRELEFIQAARSFGFSDFRIIFKHALPNALAPVFVYIAFGIASSILVESGLSFLNIGVPDDVVTWGSMLNIGRTEPEAWWMIVFPGLAIFVTITMYNLIGEGLRDALDPRQKR